MRAVLYTDDMEPITVLELPEFAERYLHAHDFVRLAVPVEPSVIVFDESIVPEKICYRTVTIFMERFIRRGILHMMLFTYDEESALLLKCAFLPGQYAALQEREREAFAKGFLEAVTHIGDM